MEVALQLSVVRLGSAIAISGSKSETNRLLLLQALYPNIQLQNTSNSDDSLVMEKALSSSEETFCSLNFAARVRSVELGQAKKNIIHS